MDGLFNVWRIVWEGWVLPQEATLNGQWVTGLSPSMQTASSLPFPFSQPLLSARHVTQTRLLSCTWGCAFLPLWISVTNQQLSTCFSSVLGTWSIQWSVQAGFYVQGLPSFFFFLILDFFFPIIFISEVFSIPWCLQHSSQKHQASRMLLYLCVLCWNKIGMQL